MMSAFYMRRVRRGVGPGKLSSFIEQLGYEPLEI